MPRSITQTRRKTLGRHDQRNHHLHAVAALVAAVAMAAFVGFNADTGDTCKQTHHGMWFSVGCPLQTFKTFLLDAPDLVTDEPPSLHVPLEFGQSVGRDWLAFGCAQCLQPLLCLSQLRIEARIPSRINVAFIRLTSRLCSPTWLSRSRLGLLASSSTSYPGREVSGIG
jgi:hypothetical protein